MLYSPSLATLLAKPDKPMHESIFAMNGGQTRKLQSYFPDPTMDIDNKVSAPLSCVSSRCNEQQVLLLSARCFSLLLHSMTVPCNDAGYCARWSSLCLQGMLLTTQ